MEILIRGAPMAQWYADELGTYGYALDIASAVDEAKEGVVQG